jgi:hypothetical protein
MNLRLELFSHSVSKSVACVADGQPAAPKRRERFTGSQPVGIYSCICHNCPLGLNKCIKITLEISIYKTLQLSEIRKSRCLACTPPWVPEVPHYPPASMEEPLAPRVHAYVPFLDRRFF